MVVYKRLLILVCLCAVVLAVGGCALAERPEVVKADYSDPANWLAVPTDTDYPIDVIYLYPTCYAPLKPSDPVMCDLDDAAMRVGADAKLFSQASLFNECANIYAPVYRQIKALYLIDEGEEAYMKRLNDKPKEDVFAALDYYFAHYNQGRPFFLAGHSQGSALLTLVLSEYMGEHPELLKRMVAAYVIGWSVTEDYLADNPQLQFAAGADDTGVIISYNTEAPQAEQPTPTVLEGAVAINPLNWRRDDTYAPVEENDGSMVSFLMVDGLADAQVDLERGVVLCTTADPYDYSTLDTLLVFGLGSFHQEDIAFYYANLKENINRRAANYLAAQTP